MSDVLELLFSFANVLCICVFVCLSLLLFMYPLLAEQFPEFSFADTWLHGLFLCSHSLTHDCTTHSGLELFLLDNTSYFLCFHSPRDRNRAYGTLQGLAPPRLALWSDPSPVEMLKKSGLNEKWRRREMSNFGMLCGVNLQARNVKLSYVWHVIYEWGKWLWVYSWTCLATTYRWKKHTYL